MKALRVRLYQNMVNYRRELSYGYVQTYPLPTPSMVRGMCHSLLDLDRYCQLKISIQGRSKGVVTNMQRVFKFLRSRDVKSSPYSVSVNGNKPVGVQHGLMYIDLHIDMELMLHIVFDDENLTVALEKAIWENIVVLGRNEDFARVDEVRMVEVREKKKVKSDFPAYVMKSSCEKDMFGTAYRLPFAYDRVENFSDKRIFSYTDVFYLDNPIFKSEPVLVDNENKPAFLLEPEREVIK